MEATTPVKLPTNQCPRIHGLESKQIKGRISTAAPQILAYLLQSLRPILHITCPDSMISYSKGSRGLFVPSRVIGIFTDTTISLSSRLRQRPDHYTIRAGHLRRELRSYPTRRAGPVPAPPAACAPACARGKARRKHRIGVEIGEDGS